MQALDVGRGKETNSLLEPLEMVQPCQHLFFFFFFKVTYALNHYYISLQEKKLNIELKDKVRVQFSIDCKTIPSNNTMTSTER